MAFEYPELLSPPVGRAAYSDRTAWIMAECAARAYKQFEKSAQTKAELESALKQGGFALVETFNSRGTQAFLARRTANEFAILANWRSPFQDHRMAAYVEKLAHWARQRQ